MKDETKGTNDPYETLKLVIEIFGKSSSCRSGLYDAQNLIFERHPELEYDDEYLN